MTELDRCPTCQHKVMFHGEQGCCGIVRHLALDIEIYRCPCTGRRMTARRCTGHGYPTPEAAQAAATRLSGLYLTYTTWQCAQHWHIGIDWTPRKKATT